MEVGAGGPAGEADGADGGVFGDPVADFDVNLVQVGIESFDLVGVADDYLMAVAEAGDFDFGNDAGGGGVNRGAAGGADVNAGMEAVKALGVAAVFSQRHTEGGFGQDVDGFGSQNRGLRRFQGNRAADSP